MTQITPLIAEREIIKAAFRFAVNEYKQGLIGHETADEYISNWETELSDEDLIERLKRETNIIIHGFVVPDFEKFEALRLFNAVSTRKSQGLPDLAEYDTFLAVDQADLTELIEKYSK